MILTYLRGVTSTRLCAGIVSALFAITAIGCSGGKRSGGDDTTVTLSRAVTLAPGAEIPRSPIWCRTCRDRTPRWPR